MTICQSQQHQTNVSEKCNKKSMAPKVLLLLLLMFPNMCLAMMQRAGLRLAIADYRREYEKRFFQKMLRHGKACEFSFGRFQSPESIQRALENVRSVGSFKWFEGKDGRKGYVSNTRLGGDWVLAESNQTAVLCTTEEVIRTYLSGELQKRWNADKVLDCQITRRRGNYYQQDMVLPSIRIIRSHTGVMKYSLKLVVDKIGKGNYCVLIQLDPDQLGTTERKPFDRQKVYVSLQQKGENVSIYAAGVMQVNRKVVPNLLVFDASGIAGDMAGKGTLWLSGYFEKKSKKKKSETWRASLGR